MYNNIAYIRVSTKEQNNGLSKETQKNNINNYANANNLHISNMVEDTGTAYNKKSNLLLDLISNNKNTNIIVYRVDRFSRNLSFANDYFSIMKNNKNNLISVYEKLNSIYIPDKKNIMHHIISAQFESEILGNRIKESIKTRKRKGSYIGNPPYGKKIIKINNIRKCINNKKEIEIINFINDFKSCLFSSRDLTKKIKKITNNNQDRIEFLDKDGYEIDYITKSSNINYQDIADLLNSYDIDKRNNKWTKNSFNKLIDNNCQLNNFHKKFNNLNMKT